MGLLYFFESTAKLNEQGYVHSCLSLYNALKGSRSLSIREIWKIPGEHKLIGVISVDSPGELDSWVASSYEHLVNGISTVFTPLRPYEDFAANVGDWLEEDTNISLVHCVPKNGLHYFLTFTVEYEGMTQEDLFKVWFEEGKAALGAKKSGIVRDLWKVVAQRKVFAIVCVEKPGDLDKISFELPVMKKMGDKVQITCKSIRQADDWMREVREIEKEQFRMSSSRLSTAENR
ncbi:uncharacterized protein LOC113686892 [Pocillopora damicornis]|nr:uncharacterized protein LOC113686892 [Pocillopora damicornis]XP_027060375.1 uncharacterized protein LOC113686892 [Pocillopora damicornis]